jgi:hypothetical protein
MKSLRSFAYRSSDLSLSSRRAATRSAKRRFTSSRIQSARNPHMCSTTSVTQRENGENPKRPAPLLPRRIKQRVDSRDHQPSAEFALIACAHRQLRTFASRRHRKPRRGPPRRIGALVGERESARETLQFTGIISNASAVPPNITNGACVLGFGCPDGNPDEFATRAFRIMMCPEM